MFVMLTLLSAVFVLTLESVSSAPVIPTCVLDMTYAMDNSTLAYPVTTPFELKIFPFNVGSDNFPIQIDDISGGTHVGTHIDAPRHFSINYGYFVDEIPLEQLMDVPIAVVDVTKKAEVNRDYALTIQDLLNWEKQTGQRLDNYLLFMRSGWGKYWPDPESYTGTADKDPTKLHFPGMSGKAADWIVRERNIIGYGTDALTLDVGNNTEFPVHRILLGSNRYGLENVANMDKLPIIGASASISPMKLKKASGAPARIIATYPRKLGQPC